MHAGPGGALSRDQFQISPPASPELLHRTVWRTWLFVAHSDEKWFIFLLPIEFSLPRLYDISLWKVWTTYFYLAMKWSNKPIILSRHVWTVYFIVSSAKRASVGAKRASVYGKLIVDEKFFNPMPQLCCFAFRCCITSSFFWCCLMRGFYRLWFRVRILKTLEDCFCVAGKSSGANIAHCLVHSLIRFMVSTLLLRRCLLIGALLLTDWHYNR